ncbi:MAG: hypothetical protein HY886_06300 [Deltaproteobacteria bacterium]|nr:hypothetical protein [Deltaproteobacteria bacterium]
MKLVNHDTPENAAILSRILAYTERNGKAGALSEAFGNGPNGLVRSLDARIEDMKAVGICLNSRLLLRLIKELATEALRQTVVGNRYDGPQGPFLDYLFMSLSGMRVEKFEAVFLDDRDKVKAVETLSEGSIAHTAVYPRKAVEECLRLGVNQAIFVHNHPSGDAAASDTDKELIVTLDKSLAVAGFIVRDHLIIGGRGCWSAAGQGWSMGKRP